MELEDNFDFLSPEDIRIKGTRIGIETVLEDFLERGLSPEEISVRYTNLTLKQVYATITYYFFNQEKIDAYLNAWRQHYEDRWQQQRRNPPSHVKKVPKVSKVPIPPFPKGVGGLPKVFRFGGSFELHTKTTPWPPLIRGTECGS